MSITATNTINLAIEDAVLFGDNDELDELIELIEDYEEVNDNLRHGLQALRYFRSHFQKDGELTDGSLLKKQKIALMELSWGVELLTLLRQSEITSTAGIA